MIPATIIQNWCSLTLGCDAAGTGWVEGPGFNTGHFVGLMISTVALPSSLVLFLVGLDQVGLSARLTSKAPVE
jgi:hypothetical protein